MFTTVIWNTNIGDTHTVAQTAPKNCNLEKHIKKLESFAEEKKKQQLEKHTANSTETMKISRKQRHKSLKLIPQEELTCFSQDCSTVQTVYTVYLWRRAPSLRQKIRSCQETPVVRVRSDLMHMCPGVMCITSRWGCCSARNQRCLGCLSGPEVQPESQDTEQTLQSLLIWVCMEKKCHLHPLSALIFSFFLNTSLQHHIMILIIIWLNHLDFKPAISQIERFLNPLDTVYFTHPSGKEPSVWKGEWKLDFWLLITFKLTNLICYCYFSQDAKARGLLLVRGATLAVRYCPVASCHVKVLPMSHE